MGFIEGILKATKKQMEWDARGMYLLNTMNNSGDERPESTVPEDEAEMEFARSWDDLTGEILDPKLVKAARKEESGYYRKMNAYEIVPIEEAWRETGRGAHRGQMDRLQ